MTAVRDKEPLQIDPQCLGAYGEASRLLKPSDCSPGVFYRRCATEPLATVYIYNIFPTSPTSARVPNRTFRSSPAHGRACARSARTSSTRPARSADAPVSTANESSESSSAERAERLVEPRSVNTGLASVLGESHTPARGGISCGPTQFSGVYVMSTFCVVGPPRPRPLGKLNAAPGGGWRPCSPSAGDGTHKALLQKRVSLRDAPGYPA